MQTPRLFPRFPGAKRPPKYQFDDGSDYDAVIEPFSGSAATSVGMAGRVQSVFLADADITVRSVLQVWLNPELHDRYYPTALVVVWLVEIGRSYLN